MSGPSLRRGDVEANPLWCLRPNHIHLLLQAVLDAGSDWWGLPRFRLPAPSSESGLTRQKEFLKHYRAAQVQCSYPDRPDTGASHGYTTADDGCWRERRLLVSVIKRALWDFCQYGYSPDAADQRIALNAWWWMAGLPALCPSRLLVRVRTEGWETLHSLKHFILLATDPVEDAFPLGLPDLLHPGEVEYYPWPERIPSQERDIMRAASFASTCEVLGVNPRQARMRAFLFPPTVDFSALGGSDEE